MKLSFLIGCSLVLLFVAGSLNTANAQIARGNTFLITTAEFAFPEDGSPAEFDSLSRLYTEKVVKKVDVILSYRVLRHWFGHNNREHVVIAEVKDWADIVTLGPLLNEATQKAFPSAEARKAFNQAYNKYFSGSHSDNIMSEVVGTRK